VAAHTFGGKAIDPPEALVEHIVASDDMPELKRMGRDPDLVWGTRPDAVYALVTLMDHASRDIGKIRIPVADLYGANDQIITKPSAFDAAARMPRQGRTAYYAGGWHILLRDYQAPVVWGDVASFIRDPKAPWPSGAPPIPASAAR
jgi:acylglycerol lipase